MKSWGAGRRRRGPNLRTAQALSDAQIEVLALLKDGRHMAQEFNRTTIETLQRRGLVVIEFGLGSSDVAITTAGRRAYERAMDR